MEWWKARLEKVMEESKEFQRGYDFAAGATLSSAGDAEDYLSELSCTREDDFDRGIRKALRDWTKHEGRLPD